MAGGIQNLTTLTNSYYANFYSESEQQANTWKQLDAVFASLGDAVPKTREEFRALVDGLDLSTTAGQSAYVALMNIQGAFASLVPATNSAAAAAAAAKTSIQSAFDALKNSISAEKTSLSDAYNASLKITQDAIANINNSVSKLSSLSSALNNTLNSMVLPGTESIARQVAQAKIESALAIAKAGGPLPDAEGLQSALGVVSKPSEQLFSSFEDYARDFLITKNNIAALGTLTDTQLSVAQQQLAVLNSQAEISAAAYKKEIDHLDKMLSQAQAQVDATNGVNNSVLSVVDSIENLAKALGVDVSTIDGSTGASAASSAGGAAGASYASAASGDLGEYGTFAALNGLALTHDAAASWYYGEAQIAAAAGNQSLADYYNQLYLDQRASINAEYAATTQPAMRSNYDAGNLDIKYTTPSNINTQSSALGGDTKLIAEIKALRTEIQSGNVAISQNTGKMARRIEMWDGDGMPAVRSV
jgi:hypothetical protein